MRDDTYKVTAAALKKRRLVTISRSTGKWNAALTHVGVHFLDHGAYPDGHWVVSNAPTRIRPRRPSTAPVTGLSPVDQLLADVTEAGGCLVRTDAQWHQWENLVASAFRFRKVPAGKILTVERGDSWSERLIVMADSPEWIDTSLREIAIDSSLRKAHPVIKAIELEAGCLRFKKSTRTGALLLLNAIVKAATDRGYVISRPGVRTRP